MKKIIIFISFLYFTIPSIAQERYIEELTDSIIVETLSYAYKDGDDLYMDIYTPAFDFEENRAVMMYIHGGGFSQGSRDDKLAIEYCRKFAELGYVAVSVSYRLTRQGKETGFGCDCPANEKLYTFDAALGDIQDAAYFLIENRMIFGIDPHKIILSGSSAGAETALNTAYQPEYCYDLESGPVRYAGVISFAGAISDTIKLYKESSIPSMLFHGTCDELVPYATAPHHYCNEDDPGYLMLYGSYTIAEKLKKLETPYWLYTFCGGDHSIATTPMTDYFEDIKLFCYETIINGEEKSQHTIISSSSEPCSPDNFEFCTNITN